MVINDTEERSNQKTCPNGNGGSLKAKIKPSINLYCVECDYCLTLTPSG